MAGRTDWADRADRADRADMAERTDWADMADRADRADIADMADMTLKKGLEWKFKLAQISFIDPRFLLFHILAAKFDFSASLTDYGVNYSKDYAL